MTRSPRISDGSHQLGGLASDLRQYGNVAIRRWWVVLGATVLCVGAAWWSLRGALPVYTAEVLLQQRTETPLIGGGPGFSGMPDFGSQQEILRSRAVLASVVDSLGLRLVARTYPHMRSQIFQSVHVDRDHPEGEYALERDGARMYLTNPRTGERLAEVAPGQTVEGPGFRFVLGSLDGVEGNVRFHLQDQQVAVERLRRQVRVEQASGRDLLRVSFRSPDAQLAAALANTVALSYQNHQAQQARQAMQRRKNVIAEEIAVLADSLRRSQEQVETYQASSQLLDPNVEGNALMAALLDTENELRRLRFDEGLLSSLVAGLRTGDSDDESLRRIMALGRELVPAGPALDQRLQDLQAERRRLTASRFGATESAPEVEVLDAQIASTREQMRITAEQSLALLGSRISAAEERLRDLRSQMGGLPARTSELTRLQQRVGAVQDVFDRLVEGYYEAQIAEGTEAGDVALVDPAPVPLWPDSSPLMMNLLLAALGGLVLGGVGALVLEQFDSRVRSASEAQLAVGLDVLGTVPRIGSRSRSPKAKLIGMEAFRGIRTNLRFIAGGEPRLLAVCSAAPSEGKTTVIVNLALALAEQGERVLLVDADLRRARIHETLGMEQAPGLAEVLGGVATVGDAIRTSSQNPLLDVLPSGRLTQSHARLFGGEGFRSLLKNLKSTYDTVLVDTPPILAVSDASLVANAVDGNIVVVRANGTDREALENAVAQLRRVKAPLVGLILNAADLDLVRYAEYYDTYYLEEDDDARKRSKAKGRNLLLGSGAGGGTDRGATG